MKGFAAATLGLVVLEVALRGNSATALEQGSGWLAAALRRLMSPDYAGVPNLAARTANTATTAATTAAAGPPKVTNPYVV